jgi:hypothetical protein
VPVKSKEKISQNFVAFSEYMTFTMGKKNMDSDWNFLLNKVFSVLAFSSSLVTEVEAAILSAAA